VSNTALTVFGIAAIVCLCIVAYFPLETRLAMPDVQSLYWGQMIAASLPIWLTAFAVLFSVVLVARSSEGIKQR